MGATTMFLLVVIFVSGAWLTMAAQGTSVAIPPQGSPFGMEKFPAPVGYIEERCSDECAEDTVLECNESRLYIKTCTNCCRLQGTYCTLRFAENGTNVCGRASMRYSCQPGCLPITPFKCRDPLFLAHCEDCFPSCAIFL